jgi:hypothetical protein
MPGDPSRRPSNERVRVDVDLNALVWVECASCLGDGWHYPMRGVVDRGPKNRKITCVACGGLGAKQVPAIHLQPGDRVITAPAGRRHDNG